MFLESKLLLVRIPLGNVHLERVRGEFRGPLPESPLSVVFSSIFKTILWILFITVEGAKLALKTGLTKQDHMGERRTNRLV